MRRARLGSISVCGAARPPPAVVTEAAVHGLASPIAFVAAIACSLAGVLLRVTAAAAAS